jgi:hypothetical protein
MLHIARRVLPPLLIALSLVANAPGGAFGQAQVIAWGNNNESQCNVPTLPPGLGWAAVEAGDWHSVARLTDGSVLAWGGNSLCQCCVPALPSGMTYLDVEAGSNFTLAIRSDGAVAAWGDNQLGQCNVPVLPTGLTYLEFAGGGSHALALRSDGAVVAWGSNGYGESNVPALPAGVTYVEVAAGYFHSVARRSDNSIVAWGENSYGQCNAPSGDGFAEIAAGVHHSVARRSDGSVVAWGDNSYGQCSAPSLPAGVTYVQITAGYEHTVARRSDHSVVAWGLNHRGQCDVPALLPGLQFVSIDAGGEHNVARVDCTQPPPGAPTALVANGTSGTQVALNWTDNADNEWGFTVERALAPSGPWGILAQLAPDSTTFQDNTATCGMTYDFRVTAFNCAGTSPPASGSGFTDSCFPLPAVYCAAKVNSIGCTPSIGWMGSPTATGPIDDFHVTASNVLNRKPGIMLWSTQPGSTPLGGGTLCLAPAVIRTAGQTSSGSPAPVVDCTGQYSFHFSHAYLQTNFLGVGQTVRAQYWSRDPGFPSPNSIGLTDGLVFVIGP